MAAPHGDEVGAQLGELYLKGRDTMPEVSGEIQTAAFDMAIASGTTAYDRDYRLGDGPGVDIDNACDALRALLTSLEGTLETCGVNIMKTAKMMAQVDHETAQAFKAAGGEL